MQKILIVNACNGKKNFIFHRLQELGYKVHVMNIAILQDIESYVSQWLLTDTQDIETSVHKAVAYYHENQLDGVVTFWEDDVLLTSKIVETLKIPGIPYSIAKNIRNKYIFRQQCKEKGIITPDFVALHDIPQKSDFENIIFPGVIKPAYGSSSAFVIKCFSFEDMKEKFIQTKALISLDVESAMHHGEDIFYESFLEGQEVDIDILLQNGEVKYHVITDNFDNTTGFFQEAGDCIPSNLPLNVQDSVIQQALSILYILGINHGCIHFEGKVKKGILTPLEINMRMGGDSVWFLNYETYGVDLIDASVKLACDIELPDMRSYKARWFLYEEYILPEKEGKIVSIDIDTHTLSQCGVVKYEITGKIGMQVYLPPHDFSYLGWYLIEASDHDAVTPELLETVKKCFHFTID